MSELGLTIELPPLKRLVIWFSAGATSAVAAKCALEANAGRLETVVAYCETGSHHEDNLRFLKDCERWLNHPITILQHGKYKSVDEVILGERYLNGPAGAACTKLLKVLIRKEFQRAATDLQVFGFHAGEVDRAADYRQKFPEVRLSVPLIKRGLFHDDCLAMLREVGIELPMLYRMGYRNNNCIGCVKGGMGYWNKVRVDMPTVFARRAKQERVVGHSCINGTFLDELDPTAGRYEAEPDIACEGVCITALQEIATCES